MVKNELLRPKMVRKISIGNQEMIGPNSDLFFGDSHRPVADSQMGNKIQQFLKKIEG